MGAPFFFLKGDAAILDRIRRGDDSALVTLYRENRRPINAYIGRNSGTRDDAEDMLQEALVILWERVRAGKFEYKARLNTFIYATVKNMWHRRLARASRETATKEGNDDPPAEQLSPLEQLVAHEESRIVRAALDVLGEPCRKLLLLFYWEERSMEEIAVELGFANAATAKSKKYQCKKLLEQELRGSWL